MIQRLCLGGCGTLVRQGRCLACRQKAERQRGTPTQRGYGTPHRKARATLQAQLPSPCGYCGEVIQPRERWVAAHLVDGVPEHGYLISHPGCNERAKGRFRAVAI